MINTVNNQNELLSHRLIQKANQWFEIISNNQ